MMLSYTRQLDKGRSTIISTSCFFFYVTFYVLLYAEHNITLLNNFIGVYVTL